MKKPKKPNFKKWVNKKGWTWWEAICLFSEIEPPKDIAAYFELKKNYKPLQIKEDEFKDKGFFEDFGIPYPNQYN